MKIVMSCKENWVQICTERGFAEGKQIPKEMMHVNAEFNFDRFNSFVSFA